GGGGGRFGHGPGTAHVGAIAVAAAAAFILVGVARTAAGQRERSADGEHQRGRAGSVDEALEKLDETHATPPRENVNLPERQEAESDAETCVSGSHEFSGAGQGASIT